MDLTVSDLGDVTRWASHVTEVAATMRPDQRRHPTRLSIVWLREDVTKVTRIGVLAPTSVLIADGIWTHLTRGGLSMITPSPLMQARCVESAIRAAEEGRHRAASEKIGTAKTELVRNGADVILAAYSTVITEPVSVPAEESRE